MSKAFPIKGFPEYYVTDNGDVYSRKKDGRFRKMKLSKNKDGYLCVGLVKNKKQKTKRVNRLVAETFIPNINNLPQVNHKNGIKTDNRVENLEWISASGNTKHTYDVLHRKPSKAWLGKFGKDHHNSKLIQQVKDGTVIAEYYGAAEAQRKTKICFGNICACCRGERNFAGGYQWRYKNA